MKSPFFLLISMICFSAVCLMNCQGKTSEEQTTTKETQEEVPAESVTNNFPNESSELALLMREMVTDLEKMKADIQEGNMPEDFREKFKVIHTAIPTEPRMKKENFDLLSKAFMNSLDKMYSEPEALQGNYKLVVANCLACHQTHCPGPIVRIEKLNL